MHIIKLIYFYITVQISACINNHSCVLPEHPDFGRWSIYGQSSDQKPVQLVPPGTILELTCYNNYKLDGESASSCIRGQWVPTISNCLPTCSPLSDTPTTTVRCLFKNKQLETCVNALNGTIARFRCAKYYETQDLNSETFRLCLNGVWTGTSPRCVPECGRKTITKSPTLIVGGTNATKGEFPWQVALYDVTNKQLFCGGTLLNQRVILTAAHCISNEKGKLLPKESITVAVGKFFRIFEDVRDLNETQYSSIQELHVPSHYRGDSLKYFGDLGIVVTTKTFTFSETVRPVCFDWESRAQNNLFDVTSGTKHASVSGWGYTVEYKNQSDVLKTLKVPIIKKENCEDVLPEEYREYLTSDKLCAGYLDSGISVCKGDSGGGLVAEYKGRQYIIAVVSLSPQAPTSEGGCDTQQYGLYTKVSDYIYNFIYTIEVRFRYPSASESNNCGNDPTCNSTLPVISRDKCVLPEHPKFGRWFIFGPLSDAVPGALVTTGTYLLVHCEQGYMTEPNRTRILCDNGQWTPSFGLCLKTCPPLEISTKVNITYSNHKLNNREIVHGTLARIDCPPFYESPNSILECQNGVWNQSQPVCKPVCGTRVLSNGTVLSTDDLDVHPWQAALYDASTQKFLCSGTLIDLETILTSAQCMTDSQGLPRSAQDFTVAVGTNIGRTYILGRKGIQFSNVKYILTNKEFRKDSGNYSGDVAAVVVQKKFTLTETVLPACIELKQTLNLEEFKEGFVPIWFKVYDYHVIEKVKLFSKSECQRRVRDDNIVDKICSSFIRCGTQVLSNGTALSPEDLQDNFPWRVYIFDALSGNLVCYGTLIDPETILTAAHCVTDSQGKAKSVQDFNVEVGNYSNMGVKMILGRQSSKLKSIFITEEFKRDPGKYTGDVAVLVVQKKFTLTKRVLPICIEPKRTLKLDEFNEGFTPLWFWHVELSLKNMKFRKLFSGSRCEENSTRNKTLDDKICTKSSYPCSGHDGSELMVKHNGRYYIIGVFSFCVETDLSSRSTKTEVLDFNYYYTNIYKYINFISRS